MQSEHPAESAAGLGVLKVKVPQFTNTPSIEPYNTPNSAFKLLLDHLEDENEAALELLYLISVLDTQGIPITLLSLCNDKWKDYTLGFRRAIRKLQSCSLIQISSDQFTVSMHEAVHTRIQQKSRSEETVWIWLRKALHVLSQIFPDSDPTYWRQCEALLPQVKRVLAHESAEDESKSSQLRRAVLRRQLGKYYHARRDYEKAYAEKIAVLETYQTFYLKDAVDTLEIEREVAGILYSQGKVQESASMNVRILSTYEKTLPLNHYLLLSQYNSLAAIIQDLGKLDEAEKYALKAFHGYEHIHGPGNAQTLIAKWNLATLKSKQLKYAESRILFEEILAEYRKIYDNSHPDILETIGALAKILTCLNKPGEAITLLQDTLTPILNTSSSKSPIVLDLQGNLANALAEGGRLHEAVDIQRSILTSIPPTHPSSILAAHNVACTLEKLSSFTDARNTLEPAAKLAESTLAPDDPTNLQVRNTLALLYLRLGENTAAEKSLRTLVATNRDMYGADRRQTLSCMNNLAGALQRQEKFAEAVEVQKEVLERCRRALGETDRLSMRAGNNLAESLRLWGEIERNSMGEERERLLDEAEKLHREVLELRSVVLGQVLDTWISSVNLGCALQAQGKTEGARKCFDVLEELEAVAGSENEVVRRGKEKLTLLS